MKRKQQSLREVTLTDVVTFPLPGLGVPGSLAFSPDGRQVAFLHSTAMTLTRQLFLRDLESGAERLLLAAPEGTTEANVSLTEALRRERLRQRELGVTRYRWSPDGRRFLIPLPAGLYLLDSEGGPLILLVNGAGTPLLDAQFSPDGRWVSYVADDELYLVPAAGGPPVQLTHGAREAGKTHGLAEYIAQEEMGRRHGYWWSPDSRWLAFTEVDERHIPIYHIVHQGKDAVGDGAEEDHHYPFAGADNAHVRLGVIAAEGGSPRWLDLGPAPDMYLARVKWLPDGGLAVQRLNREQDCLDLLRFDPRSGRQTRLLRETSDVWINLHDLFYPLRQLPGQAAGGFVWGSERTGYLHLYLHDADGALVRPLTAGEWVVDAIAGVDEAAGLVYFTASQPLPTESNLFVAPLAGGEPRRLTTAPGTHHVILDGACRRFLDVHSATDQAPVITLRSLADGSLLQPIYDAPDPRLGQLALPPPEMVTLPNRAGDKLYAAVYRPPARFGRGPHPTIVSVYGGPHAQRVTNSWVLTADMRAQYLASQGFLVFKLDNRGSARRGLAFEGAIRHNLGQLEVEDQVDGVRWLAARGDADPQRVGIYGWSYGGYLAAMCLLRAADTFRTAVAGAPVTHWDGYDTCYTERYMGRPQTNPHGYENSSVMAHVAKLEGKLLLVHGLIDENVHFRHTARLINSLISAQKPYDLLLFPDERHMPRGEDGRQYMEERIRDYFLAHLA